MSDLHLKIDDPECVTHGTWDDPLNMQDPNDPFYGFTVLEVPELLPDFKGHKP